MLPPLALLTKPPKKTVANFEIVSLLSNLFNKIITNNVPGLRSSIFPEKEASLSQD